MANATIKAYRLKSDSMGGSEWLNRVYLDQEVANMVAESKKAEWIGFNVHPVEVRVLNETEGAVGHDLVTIDRTTAVELYRQRALAKLTPKERVALDISSPAGQPTLAEAKISLYRMLLATPGDKLTEEDIDLQAALAGDTDIQKVLGAQAQPK